MSLCGIGSGWPGGMRSRSGSGLVAKSRTAGAAGSVPEPEEGVEAPDEELKDCQGLNLE